MSIVNLVSGGLDSTLISIMAKEEGVDVYPLFIDYGQRAVEREWAACLSVHQRYDLPFPKKMNLSGFGKIILTGLTSVDKDVKTDVFTPGRNLLFLIAGASYAFQVGASAISIGLLSEKYSLFPDQRASFIEQAEAVIQLALGKNIRILTPLFSFSKVDILALAAKRGIEGTYSCHSGTDIPCGKCISCLEVIKPSNID